MLRQFRFIIMSQNIILGGLKIKFGVKRAKFEEFLAEISV